MNKYNVSTITIFFLLPSLCSGAIINDVRTLINEGNRLNQEFQRTSRDLRTQLNIKTFNQRPINFKNINPGPGITKLKELNAAMYEINRKLERIPEHQLSNRQLYGINDFKQKLVYATQELHSALDLLELYKKIALATVE